MKEDFVVLEFGSIKIWIFEVWNDINLNIKI